MSAVNRLKVTDVRASAPSTKGGGEAQRPALFCAGARVTGGKRAIGTRRTIGFPVKVQHLCVWGFFLVAKLIKRITTKMKRSTDVLTASHCKSLKTKEKKLKP